MSYGRNRVGIVGVIYLPPYCVILQSSNTMRMNVLILYVLLLKYINEVFTIVKEAEENKAQTMQRLQSFFSISLKSS